MVQGIVVIALDVLDDAEVEEDLPAHGVVGRACHRRRICAARADEIPARVAYGSDAIVHPRHELDVARALGKGARVLECSERRVETTLSPAHAAEAEVRL